MFAPTTGLRQGDPLSPYLFLFCAEGLISLLKKTGKVGTIQGIIVAKESPRVYHLFFIDDSLLFYRARLYGGNQNSNII